MSQTQQTTQDFVLPKVSSATGLLSWLGALSVLAGGLVAAVTGPLELYRGSWLAAYLVLVCGVAAWIIGLFQLRHNRVSQGRLQWFELASWCLGNALVILGTLVAMPGLVYTGSGFLTIALVSFLRHSLRWTPSRQVWGYRVVLAVLMASVPVGMLLSFLRHG